MSQNENDCYSFLTVNNPWKHNPNAIWLGSTLTLNRNLEKFNFPGKLSSEKRKQIVSLLSTELIKHSSLKNPMLYKGENLTPLQKEFLVEHFLSHHSFHQAHIGEAFILEESGEFLAEINMKDHLNLSSIDLKEDLENVLSRLVNVEMSLNKYVNYSFSPQFGYLTADPTESGTGLIVTIYLHLLGLRVTERLDEAFKKYAEEGISHSGLQGDPNEMIGDIIAFKNLYTLGVTEENILSSIRSMATKLVVEEKVARNHLKQEHDNEVSELKDRVSRAYGILMHSYQIETIEALNAMSLLKFGLDIGWVNGITHETLNYLFFACRRAYLLCHFEEKMASENLSHKRSEYIHQILKPATLLI